MFNYNPFSIMCFSISTFLKSLGVAAFAAIALPLIGQAQDMAIGNVSAGFDYNRANGRIFDVYFDVLNNSDNRADAYTVSLYFVDPNDNTRSYRLRDLRNDNGQNGNTSVQVTIDEHFVANSLNVPPAGSYRLAVLVDPDEELNDPNRNNNSLFISTQGNNLIWDGTSLRLGGFVNLPLLAYPNPAADRLTLQAEPQASPATYTLLDNAGRTLLTGTVPAGQAQFTLDVSTLPAGLYTVQLTTGNARGTQRIAIGH
jgi:hypothetical protein